MSTDPFGRPIVRGPGDEAMDRDSEVRDAIRFCELISLELCLGGNCPAAPSCAERTEPFFARIYYFVYIRVDIK